jgi:hypothetical protein
LHSITFIPKRFVVSHSGLLSSHEPAQTRIETSGALSGRFKIQ